MEVELVTDDIWEDENYALDEINEDVLSLDGERCGICMDVVIDRGVLDCCQHWFCFSCIDNWATITSLCPLCQNEFQMITCVPVYDTVGGNKSDEDTEQRDDDWFVEGKNNTLSFPSYYIDENSVVCLDGDGCKIRSGSVNIEEELDIDTSIACDSCDKWYHAFCVGFDTEGTCDSSWLCPRCTSDNTPHKSNEDSTLQQINQHNLGTKNDNFPVQSSFSERVSVSVADDGETAIVISLVKGSHMSQESSELEMKNETLDNKNGIKLISDDVDNNIAPAYSSDKLLNPGLDLDLGLPAVLDISDKDKDTAEDHVLEFTKPDSSSEKYILPDKIEMLPVASSPPEEKETVVKITTGTKRKQRDRRYVDDGGEASNEDRFSKKIKASRNSQLVSRKDQTNESTLDDLTAIIQGSDHRPRNQIGRKYPSNISSKERENATGLRLKKIMRRTEDDKSSSVEELRKKIREAVRDKSSKDAGNKLFDPKLLDAFREALTGMGTENRKPVLDVRAKRSLLQKGKVRESLTKKIYGNGGKRKRAWTRECEVEFWKHRCSKTSKPEKIQTLNSVLALLRDDSGFLSEKKEGVGEEPKVSILSRLYLADNSLVPRKSDIKPVLELNNVATPAQERASGSMAKPSILPKKNNSSSHEKKTVNKSDDTTKGDKRKWAMELLARKAASSNKNEPQDRDEDNAILKGNYSLLSQLPKEMRPVLAASRHNKIPISIRQAQLHRLAEHFLKKANLSTICKTAEMELAVADAVNIERQVADKSSSKLVYTNLCSQEILRRSNITNSESTKESNLCSISNDGQEEKAKESDLCSNSDNGEEEKVNIDDALRNAGLLSDSPPNSPLDDVKSGAEGPDNVLEVDSRPELDIFGDFEYNLEEEDFIGAGALKISEPCQEPKIKLVFSSLNREKPNGTLDPLKGSLDSRKETSGGSYTMDGRNDGQDLSVSGDGEPSHAECEELYGPDKEPLIQKYPDSLSTIVLPNENGDNKDTGKSIKNSEVAVTSKSSSVSKESDSNEREREKTSKEKTSKPSKKKSEINDTVTRKVEAYIKEHVRPLCKSGVITIEQYRWAVEKTTEKVMKYHTKEKNANFLIKEGEKVKKLAEQYVEAAQKKEKN